MQILKQSQTITWHPAEVAKTWPVGSCVLIRRAINGESCYETHNFFSHHWVDDVMKLEGEWSWALIEAAGE